MKEVYEPSLEKVIIGKPLRNPNRGYAKFDEPFRDFNYGLADEILQQGGIDLHIHAGPCAYVKRPYGEDEIAIEASKYGMRAVVFKDHATPTAGRKIYIQRIVDKWAEEHGKKSTEVLGGVVLNYPVGGLNPAAVDVCSRLGGKFVWTPSIHSSHHYKVEGVNKPGISVLDERDKVVSPLREIFDIVAQKDMVLVLGHASVKERFVMIDTAKSQGVKRILIDHPSWWLNKATVDQQAEMARKGAYIGLYYCAVVPNISNLVEPGEVYDVVEKIPNEQIVGGTDLAAIGHPHPVDGMRKLIHLMLYGGIPRNIVEKVFVQNPAKLIWG